MASSAGFGRRSLALFVLEPAHAAPRCLAPHDVMKLNPAWTRCLQLAFVMVVLLAIVAYWRML